MDGPTLIDGMIDGRRRLFAAASGLAVCYLCINYVRARAERDGRGTGCVVSLQAVQAVVCTADSSHTRAVSRVNLFFESSQRGSMSVSWRVSQERAALPRHSSRRRDPSPPHHVV